MFKSEWPGLFILIVGLICFQENIFLGIIVIGFSLFAIENGYKRRVDRLKQQEKEREVLKEKIRAEIQAEQDES
jgi:hypothetical protein